MKVLIHNDRSSAEADAARRIATAVRRNPQIVLGLATGHTPVAIYAHLAGEVAAGRLSFRHVQTFNLDEYVGIGAQDPQSFRAFMDRHLFSQIDIDPANTHVPQGDAVDPESESVRYEAALHKAGNIGLQLLGIGENGHIGFNEPMSSLGSRTRLKTLTEDTRRANSADFPSLDAVPRVAITMGIGNILETREVLLVALGAGKADAVAALVEGPVSAVCPASALQLHRSVTVILDEPAASKLKFNSYYAAVHPGGQDETHD